MNDFNPPGHYFATDGPWYWGDEWQEGANSLWADDRQILFCDRDPLTGGMFLNVTVGNRRLIAAAPDLLLACKAALLELGTLSSGHSPSNLTWEWMGELRAAIGKAEGEA